MDYEELECLICKKNFVDRLSYAISGMVGRCGIADVRYEAYENQTRGFIEEILIVEFYGGAISTRNVHMNSHSAILRELGNLVDGGYYQEVEHYKLISNSSDWKLIVGGN